MSGARGVHCEKCGQSRDMGCYDIIGQGDSTRWKLQCFTCNTVQSGSYDPRTINAW